MGFILWGAFLFLGATGLDFKKGLLFSALAAAAFTALGAFGRQADPLCQSFDCSITMVGLAYNFAIKFVICLLFYGIGKGGAALYRKFKKPASDAQ